jgi:hypothetical protein
MPPLHPNVEPLLEGTFAVGDAQSRSIRLCSTAISRTA